MFGKILIANRAAIARRVVRACRDLGITSVAVYSEADAGLPHVEEADEAYPLAGVRADETYLNQAALLEILRRSGADAVHPGYGFLSENAAFAAAVDAAGATFIGPAPDAIRRLGDKLEARALVAETGFPVLPGSGRLADVDSAVAAAAQLGYPLMLKPAAGGGGIGMRRVDDAAALAAAFGAGVRLAESAFGDGRLYLEQCQVQPRHIEIQLLADRQGQVMHAFERDCSLQRRQQKVIEEAPAPGLDRSEIEPLLERAVTTFRQLGYDNLGTLEMLRGEAGDYGFLEVNARIQVEHGVTELVTGLDLVQEQIRLAAGGALPAPPVLSGFAMEARVLAQDSRTGYASTGRLTGFRTPQLRFVRVETGYCEGAVVTPYYDGLLAKVLAWGGTREQAIGRLLVGLRAFDIRGVQTNVEALCSVLQSPAFIQGRVHTGFLG